MNAATDLTTQTLESATTTPADGPVTPSPGTSHTWLRHHLHEHLAHARLLMAVHALVRTAPTEPALTRWFARLVLTVLHEPLLPAGPLDDDTGEPDPQ